MNSGLFLMPASVSAGDLLLVALKMPPSRIGTYSNFAPVRFSIAGIASWLRKALGLPTSNRNCGFWLTAVSPDFLDHYGSDGTLVRAMMIIILKRRSPQVKSGATPGELRDCASRRDRCRQV